MIAELLKTYSINEWDYLNINEIFLRDHHEWININFPLVDLNYPWAIRNDIQRLFHLCISFKSKNEVLDWINNNLDIKPNEVHLGLIDSFCYSKVITNNKLDMAIDKSDDFLLLNFIHSILERALLWYDPEPCWPSDFFYILRIGKSIINQSNKTELVSTESLKTKGVDLVSTDEHTHVFYKFQNICSQLQENKIYSDIKTIAKQSHSALLKSVNLFLEHRISTLDEIRFEKKLDSIMEMETLWCKSIIEKQKYNTI
jgi:hypothetical protein